MESHNYTTPEEWLRLLIAHKTPQSEINPLMCYIQHLLDRGLPVIISNNHLAALIGISWDSLKKMSRDPSSYYYKFWIPKRNGTTRRIDAPNAALFHIQRWIYDEILKKESPGEFAKGFVMGRSVVDNAKVHLGCRSLLKIDLENFFPSISQHRILAVFLRMGYTRDISYLLSTLCSLSGCLPQGAPTSPMISNLVAKRFDRRIGAMASKLNLKYSRYADDLTLSGENISKRVSAYVEKIALNEGFKINHDKTSLVGEAGKKIITGVSISGGKLTVPREFKRKLRQEIYYISTYGLKNHYDNTGNFDVLLVERLLGKLNFWKMVEPDSEYVMEAIKRMSILSSELDRGLFK